MSGRKGNILGYRSANSPAAPQGHDTKRHFGIHILGVSDLLARPLDLVRKGQLPTLLSQFTPELY